ncbi:MAG TPA: hypothetical protein VFV95_19490 [Vicinamibacterales bacterium]|nr:hypothetical protein [Vicinamibacterales bacterium]
MPAIDSISQVVELSDARLKKIAKRTLRTLQLEAEKAVVHHAEPAKFRLAADPDSSERIFLARFKELNQTKQQAAVVKAMASVTAPEAQRQAFYGDLAKIDLRSETIVEKQVRARPFPADLRFPKSHLEAVIAGHVALQIPHLQLVTQGDAILPQQVTDNLEFRVHKVRCDDETNPEFAGDDEIALGGLSVDETGDTKQVGQFTVRSDFDDGEQQVYVPPRRFTFFNLREGTTFPKDYAVTLVLAEKDMGGLHDFIVKLWEKVKSKVLEYAAAAVGAAVGSATFPGLGTIIGAVVGWALGKLIEWLIGLFSDDIFTPVTLTCKINGLANLFTGNKTDSPEGLTTFSGYGGRYSLTYDWRKFA